MTHTICGVDFTREAFRLEHQAGPQAEELDAYHRWLEGNPLLPVRWRDWQAWLDRVQAMDDVEISRVILLDNPLTQYQQWRMWAHHGITWPGRKSCSCRISVPSACVSQSVTGGVRP